MATAAAFLHTSPDSIHKDLAQIGKKLGKHWLSPRQPCPKPVKRFQTSSLFRVAAIGLNDSGGPGIGLTSQEIRAAFSDHELSKKFGPILSSDQVADLLELSRSTIYFWIQQGRLDGAVNKRGKRRLIWRDRAI